MTLRAIIFACLLALLAAPVAAGAAEPAAGVYVLDEDFDAPDSAEAMHGARNAGASEVRKDLLWRAIETRRGHFDWSAPDPVVAAAAVGGLDMVATLVTTPQWAVPAAAEGEPGIFPPADVADFARFAAEAVKRYGPDGTYWSEHPDVVKRPVRAWQIWNEPNLTAFWRPAPDPFAYTRLLAAAAAAIRALDPGAEIIIAGMPESLGGVAPGYFLSRVYAAGGASSFDTLAVHPYAPDVASLLAGVHQMRGVADRSGDAETPLRVTEFGWATAGLPSLFTTDERTQANLLYETVLALRAAAPALRLKGFVYFKWRDHPKPADAPDIWPYHSGLLRMDGSAKPALEAFAAANAAPLPAPVEAVSGSPAPLPALHVRARVPRQRGDRLARRGLKVRAGCSRACDLHLVVAVETRRRSRRVRRVVARLARRVPDGRGHTLVTRLRRRDVRAARRAGSRVIVRISATDSGQAVSLNPVNLRILRNVLAPLDS